MCPDFVEDCWGEGCYNPEGGPYSKSRKWFLGDWPNHPFCDHLAEQFGTRNSDLYAHVVEYHDKYGDEHYQPEMCWSFSSKTWQPEDCYPVEELRVVCDKLNADLADD